MRADNYTLSLITAAGIRPALKLVICLESQAPPRPPLIWDLKLKQRHVFLQLQLITVGRELLQHTETRYQHAQQ